MAENAKGTSLQELKDKVHSGLDLVSDEELAMLFEEAEKISQVDPTQQQATPDPSPAPVSAEPAPPAEETPKGQASLLDKVPEKFKGNDEAATLNKMLKALQDTETALTQSNQERSQLQGLVQELSKKPREEYRPQVTTPTPQKEEDDELDAVDDATFFDKPMEIIKKVRAEARKIAQEESAKTVQHYDTFATRRDVLAKFKSTHSDFDNFRQEIVEVCKMHPEWDNDIDGLPKIYEAAKTLAIAKARSLNPQTTTQSNVNVEELTAKITAEVEAKAYDKAKQAIIEEVKRRKAASGILSSRDASSSSSRVDDGKKTTPMTAEEKVIDDMVKSGPKTLGLGV